MAILAGLFFGIMAAVPVGPVGILAIAQRYSHGFWRGFSAASASAALEVVYCLIAVEAAGFVNQFILRYSQVMKFVGTAVLVGVGVGILRQARTLDPTALAKNGNRKELHPIAKAVALHVTSPTIPVYCLTVAGLALAYGWVVRGELSAVLFSVACGLGSALWSFVLLRFILRTPRKLKAGTFRKMFLVLGVVLLILGALNFLSVWIELPGLLKAG
jgi:threonine/homoserine/homoserine lactone efflux protein